MPPVHHHSGHHGGVKLKNVNKQVLKRLMQYLRAYRFSMLVVLIFVPLT